MSSLDKNSTDRALEHFLRRIILIKRQHERASTAVSTIKTTIRNSDACPSDASIFEQGSFSTRTTLKPDTKRLATAEFDVDIAIESNQWDTSDPKSALEIVHDILLNSGIPASRLKVKASCVRIIYADGSEGEKFHVDVVPILIYGTTKYAAKCTPDENMWVESDPGKLTRWFNSKTGTEPTFRAQYLLMKRFAQMNGIKIPSIAIQKITSDAYVFNDSSSRYLRELLDMCRIVLQNLSDPNYALTNPVNSDENIRERIKDGELDKYKDLISNVVKSIERFSTNGTYADVVALFGDKFPVNESHERELSLRAKGIYFDCDFSDRVLLTASATKGDVDNTSYFLTVAHDHSNYEGRPAVDNIKLTVSNILPHHVALWQIMNDPKEVPFQIRGNFEESNEESKRPATEHRSESISYAGKHFVRAFIVKGDRYKAVSHRFDVNVARAAA